MGYFWRKLFKMTPLVSVLMVTHNHADYIQGAIESVLMQETPFPFELVIGEDASTDDTADLIKIFASAHPEKIFAVHHRINIGMSANFFDTLNRCRGKYIAMLDGDDRWVRKDKLVLQVDYLEQHPEVVICGGSSFSESRVNGGGYRLAKMFRVFSAKRRECFGRSEMIISNRLKTLTVMGRAEAFKEAVSGIGDCPVLDWPLYINLSRMDEDRKYVNLPYMFAAYNIHSGGVFSGSRFRSRLRISAHARETITSLTRGRYWGWHFPVCHLSDPANFDPAALEQHYHETFPAEKELFFNGEVMEQARGFLYSGEHLPERFGFIFGRLFSDSKSFSNFTKKVTDLMRMILRSSVTDSEKRALLGSVGTAWRDTLFYSRADARTFWHFLRSPLRRYSGIYWYTIVLVYRQSHIRE